MSEVIKIDYSNWNLGMWLLFAFVGMVLVIAILALIVGLNIAVSKGLEKVTKVTSICPREENKILDEDKDAAVALVVATIEFESETHKDSNLISIEKIEG